MGNMRETEWRFDEPNNARPGNGEAGDLDPSNAEAGDPRLVAAVQEYLAALESGTPPPRRQFVDQHPEIAWELEKCLDGLEIVHAAALSPRRKEARPGDLVAEQGQLPLGDFHIVREIGRGGMGVVYEAFQLSLGRRVAVKVLPFAASLDRARLERFRNEAQAAAHLHHTNIVPVYAVGVERGIHFYAMQLIEGQSLAASVRRLRQSAGRFSEDELGETHPPLGKDDVLGDVAAIATVPAETAQAETSPPDSTVLTDSHPNPANYFRTVARLVQQAAAALEHAHRMGVVHRDIKPANLLLDGRGNIWITDFGLAQFHIEAQLTHTGDMLGTLRYMSPEQAAGGRVLLDHRTDIYSLGVTMYELLTLEPAFGSDDRQDLLRHILEDDPPSPCSIDRSIPVDLETIVLKAIAKTPNDRYASAQQLADDLQRWLDDKPILARRPTLLERAARWRRRHRGIVRAAIAFLFLATLGLIAGTLVIAGEHSKTKAAYKREITQREAAEESFRQARQAVDSFTQLGEEELANNPSLHQLRRRFLETSLDYYRNFLDQRRDDSALQTDLAATSARVERIVDELALLEELAPLTLLSDSRIQQELAIKQAQRAQLNQLVSQLSAERRQAQTNGKQQQDSSQQGASQDDSSQQSLTDALRSDKDKIVALLGEPQIHRLKQIYWQQQGPMAFKSPLVVAALQLTHDQRQQINNIVEEERPGGPSHEPPGPGGPHHHAPSFGGPPSGDALAGDAPPSEPPGHGPGFGDRGPESGMDRGPFHGPHGPHGFGPGRGEPPHGPPGPPGQRHGDPDKADSREGESGHSDEPPGDPRPFADKPTRSAPTSRTLERIVALLTPEQSARWKDLIGQPYLQQAGQPPDDDCAPDGSPIGK